MIRITTIGVPDIRSGSTRIRPDAEVLFGLAMYLGLNAGTPIPRDTLLRIFWPGVADADARHSLRQLLYRLRKGSLPIDVDGAVLMIERKSVATDLDAILSVEDPAMLTREQMIGLDRVLSDYTPHISPEFAEWVDSVRSQVESRYRRALMSLIAAARLEGRWSDLEHWSQKCLRIDPLNEEATLARAEASAMVGAKAEAMSILAEFVAELGEKTPKIGLPAQMLRKRISEQVGQESTSSTVPLIGRTREVAVLTQCIESVVRGTSAVVRIHGTVGIGKSRLASEAVGIARLRGFSIASVRLAEPDASRPMSLMMDLAARLVVLPGALGCAPEALSTVRRLCEKSAGKIEDGTPASMQVVREQTRRALIELLEALTDERPLLIWIDNADHVDQTSQALLAELAAGTRERRLLWQLCGSRLERCTFISDEPHGSAAVKLTGLSLTETAQLAQMVKPYTGKPEDTEARGAWLQKATGGNPLFVRELASNEWKSSEHIETPPSLREVVRRRLARLSPSATRTLRACAMMGAHASIGALIEVLECEPSALHEVLEELDQEALVANDAASPLWVHEIIGQEVLDQSSPAVIRLLHFQVGTAIAKRATESWSPRLAWDAAGHLAKADETAQAVSLLVQTANHQMAIGMPAAAATTFRRACETTENKAESAALLECEVKALASAGDWARTRIRLRDIELGDRAGVSEESRDELELLRLRADWHLGPNLSETFESAISFSRRQSVDLTRRSRALALACMMGDNLLRDDFISLATPIADEIERTSVDTPPALLEARAILAFNQNDLETSIEHFLALAEAYRDKKTLENRARSLVNVSYPLELRGRLDEGLKCVGEAYSIASDYRMASVASRSADRQSGLLFETARLLESREWIERAETWSDATADPTFRRSIASQQMKLFVHSGQSCSNDEALRSRRSSVLSEDVLRVRVHDLALLMFWACKRGDYSDASVLLDVLAESYRSAKPVSRPDYILAAIDWTAQCTEVESPVELRSRVALGASSLRRPWYRDAVERGRPDGIYLTLLDSRVDSANREKLLA